MIKSKAILVLSAACLLGAACGSDDPPTTDPSVFPILGTQIDRMGRAGVATALIGAFEPDDDTRNDLKDQYSQDGDVASWGASYAAGIAAHLAILDGVDGSVGGGNGCGNQLTPTGGTIYTDLAGALADDRLLIDQSQTTCAQYLAVEANLFLSAGIADCGGRTPVMDTIAVTYGVTVAVATFPAGVSHGPTTDADAMAAAAFPYFTAPN